MHCMAEVPVANVCNLYLHLVIFYLPARYNFVRNGVHIVSYCWLGCLAQDVVSGLGHTSKGLPETTIGCEVHWALWDSSQLNCWP